MWRRLMQALVLTQGPYVMGAIELGLNRADLMIQDHFVPANTAVSTPFVCLVAFRKGTNPGESYQLFSCQLFKEWHQLIGFIAYLMQTYILCHSTFLIALPIDILTVCKPSCSVPCCASALQ